MRLPCRVNAGGYVFSDAHADGCGSMSHLTVVMSLATRAGFDRHVAMSVAMAMLVYLRDRAATGAATPLDLHIVVFAARRPMTMDTNAILVRFQNSPFFATLPHVMAICWS